MTSMTNSSTSGANSHCFHHVTSVTMVPMLSDEIPLGHCECAESVVQSFLVLLVSKKGFSYSIGVKKWDLVTAVVGVKMWN